MNFCVLFTTILNTILTLSYLAEGGRNKGKGRRIRRMDETFFMSEMTRRKFERFFLTREDRRGDTVTPWSETSDPKQNIHGMLSPSHACPWTYVLVNNPNRIPPTTLEAECSSEQCKAFTNAPTRSRHRGQGQSPNLRGFPYLKSNSPDSPRCAKVHFYRWVRVKRTTRSGKNKYVKRILPVAVSCSCVQDPESTVPSS